MEKKLDDLFRLAKEAYNEDRDPAVVEILKSYLKYL